MVEKKSFSDVSSQELDKIPGFLKNSSMSKKFSTSSIAKKGSIDMGDMCQYARVIFFVKPFDDEVFENFFILIKYIQDEEIKYDECGFTLIVPPDLLKRITEAVELMEKYGITKHFESYEQLTDQFRKTVDYIITLGGDGLICYAAKQFSGEHIPPMITFNQGSLGFMCNFVF